MSTAHTLFSLEEIERAQARLALTQRPIADAIWFHASLEALKMDANRLQQKGPGSTVFAIDAVEIVSYCNYSSRVFSAFKFNNLLNGGPDWTLWIEKLDHLFAREFFEERKEPFILLDSYFDEVVDVLYAIDNSLTRVQLDIAHHTQAEHNRFDGFTVESLRRIQDFITSGKNFGELKDEFRIFTERFLPQWRVEFIDALVKHSGGRLRMETVLAGGGYVHLRDDSFGAKAIARSMPGFDWQGFQRFLGTEPVKRDFAEVVSATRKLLSNAPRRGRNAESIGKAAVNDSHALADIHTINSFLEEQGDPQRVELVTRSPLIHSLIRALPTGRLRVQLRHPLLLPEAFQFSEGSIATISDFAERFNSLLAPYLEDYWNEKAAAYSRSDGLGPPGEITSNREKHDSDRAAEIARDFVGWLRDTSLIQVGSDADDETLTRAYEKSLPATKGGHRRTHEGALISEIKNLFELIIQNLERRDNPLTYIAFRELIRKNVQLASVVWGRAFGAGDEITTRVIEVNDSVIAPESFIAVKMSGLRQTRVFHLYSPKAAKIVLDQVKRLKAGKATQPHPHSLVEIALTKAQTLDRFTELLKTFDGSGPDQETRTFTVDMTLIVAMALASRGEARAAISLVSTVLHELTSMLRLHEDDLRKLDRRLRLSYQELLLFRHYCERQIAVAEFRTQRAGMTTAAFLRGSVEKNYARAQRDLDFAATLGSVDIDASSPRLAASARLRMVHMSGWMDMYLLTTGLDLTDGQSGEARPQIKLVHRRDIWAALGFVKESMDDIEQLRLLRESCADVGSARYLAHLEARILQNALTMFIVFLFGRDVPVMKRMLDPNFTPLPEHVLKFRNWHEWWISLRGLTNDFGFSFTMMNIFEVVLGALEQIAATREDEDQSPASKRAAGQAITSQMVQRFKELKSDQTGFVLTLVDHILSGSEAHTALPGRGGPTES